MTWFLLTALFILLVLFFGSILIQLLPILLIFMAVRLIFFRPSVKVYTRSFTFPQEQTSFGADPFARSIPKQANPVSSASDIIDVEYSETDR